MKNKTINQSLVQIISFFVFVLFIKLGGFEFAVITGLSVIIGLFARYENTN